MSPQALLIATGVIALLAVLTCVFLVTRLQALRNALHRLEVDHATLQANSEEARAKSASISALQRQMEQYLEEKAAAASQIQLQEREIGRLREQIDGLLEECVQLREQRFEAEKRREAMMTELQQQEKRIQDWEKLREQSLQNAKAAVLEAGNSLSTKLLEDHKREVEQAKKDAETLTKQVTEKLATDFTSLAQTFEVVKSQQAESREKTDTLWKALSTPAAVGQLAEIGLENTLKNLGLEAGRDFITQYSMNATGDSASRLRPDAVIFLPHDTVMVIDCKASKFLLELAQHEAQPEQQQMALSQFAASMNRHLKDLSAKDYQNAVAESYRKSGRGHELRRILSVMYLPAENAILKLQEADSDFRNKVEKLGLILASPASLHGLLMMAKMEIGLARQEENEEKILKMVSDLMASTIDALKHVSTLERGLMQSVNAFDSIAGSVNRYLLPRMKQIHQLGLHPSKNKPLPSPLASIKAKLAGTELVLEAETLELSSEKSVTVTEKESATLLLSEKAG